MAGSREDREEQDKALAAFGLVAEGRPEPEPVEMWPENEVPAMVFSAMQTQWRFGLQGATGLDYTAMPAVMGLAGVKKKHRADVFSAVQVMEREVLRLWAERRDKQGPN